MSLQRNIATGYDFFNGLLGISAGAVALWLLVWALLFRGRLGLG